MASPPRRTAAVPAPDPDVAQVFASYPANIRTRLMKIRTLIFKCAAAEGIGPLTETLKWGEPAYLTLKSKSGSTIRMGWKPSAPDRYAMYFNCRTTLVDTFRTLFPELSFDGNRAIVFDTTSDLPMESLGVCITAALTYHRTTRAAKKKPRRAAG